MITRNTRRPGSLLAACILGLCAIASVVSPSAQAQWYPTTWNIVVPASTTTDTTAIAPVIDATQAHEFAMQVRQNLSGAGTSAVTFTMARSLDSVNWITAFTIAATASGTTAVNIATNVTAQAYPYWKVTSVQNANANPSTNAVIFGVKVGVREYSR